MTLDRRFAPPILRLVLLLLALSVLAGCSSEPSERKAFADFLQTRILDKPGVRLPVPNEDDRKQFGRYTTHYDVILRYSAEMEKVLAPMKSTLQSVERMRTLDAVMNGGATIEEARTGMAGYREQMTKQLAQSERERVALEQAEDLKTLFDAAYRRTVTDPAALVDTQIGLFEEILTHYAELASFLDANRAVIRISGMTAQVSDPKVQDEVQARLKAIEAMRQPMEEVQDKLRKLVHGA